MSKDQLGSFQEVAWDISKPPSSDLYNAEVGFVRIAISPDPGRVSAEVTFLEQEGWAPYTANTVGVSRERFESSLANPYELNQFASIVLRDQVAKVEVKDPDALRSAGAE